LVPVIQDDPKYNYVEWFGLALVQLLQSGVVMASKCKARISISVNLDIFISPQGRGNVVFDLHNVLAVMLCRLYGRYTTGTPLWKDLKFVEVVSVRAGGIL
jgi:hypothetical protein